MKCINKLLIIIVGMVLISSTLIGCEKKEPLASVRDYEAELNCNLYTGDLFASDLAVTKDDVNLVDFSVIGDDSYSSGLFDVNKGVVYYANSVHEKIYPASTTKILTAYIAFKYGNMEDVVVASDNVIDLPGDSSMAGIKPGDTLTLYDLVNGLMLCSGNDCGVAIAEHLSGNIEDFAELMNKEANALGATNSHFMNPHGMPNDDHYTTAYDLYLIFKEAIKNEEFVKVIAQSSYTANFTDCNNAEKQLTWKSTSRYKDGREATPMNVEVIGGKTGTTNLARSCLVELEQDADGNPYISIVMGASSPVLLYDVMTPLIEAIPSTS